MTEFVKVEYTGKIKETGEVFDTTSEEIAKKGKLNTSGRKFGSIPMILGENLLIKGFEETVAQMKVGEEKKVELPPEKAYGNRSPELVKLIPISTFKKHNIAPYPGMMIVLENGMPAKVQSVSGGRVRVDFNHELAGKTLEFTVKLIEKIQSQEDKIKALFELNFPEIIEQPKISKTENEIEVMLPKKVLELSDLQQRKIKLSQEIKKFLKIEKVKISEEY